MANIVVVDDSFYMRTMLKHILTDAGHNVIGEAPNAEAAIQLIKEKNPDLVTLDVILPDNTGLDVLRILKEEMPHLKVIMVSAVGQNVIVDEAMALGAKDYIVKPFSEEKVLATLERVLA
ncbi:MAG TPA: response regulator [Cytophagaceae bacterium]|jgi:two-component system chemotaxis response regulator CheY